MNQVRGYGEWNVSDFRQALSRLGPGWDCNDPQSIQRWVEHRKKRGHYDSFLAAFREFLLDDSLSLSEKAELYFEEVWSDADTWDYCKWLWELIAPNQPWPLEGRPRPDEPKSKIYEFKP